jgi:uncharacterized protein (DUF1800 family)
MVVEQKVSHLLRRFGLSAGRVELDKYLHLGVEGTIDRLIDYEKVDVGPTPQVWEWYVQQDAKYSLDPSRVRSWWQYRMLTTERPLEEKLTLFWHNHFAISGSKCDFGPLMHNYVDTMRDNASGSFSNILIAVSKTPAMLKWLDLDQSVPGHPNENFAREVMELFTLGIGNYTEKDVQEASRTFLGWSLRYPIYERLGGDQNQKIQGAIEYGWPLVASSFSPEMRDMGHKTILGRTAAYDADMFLRVLAYHPITAKRMVTKLFTFFAYDNPTPATIDKFVKVWYKNDLHIKPLLKAIAHSDEFWSDQCLRTKVKSPVDFALGQMRQVGGGAKLGARRPHNALPTQTMLTVAGDEVGQLARTMRNQGLDMLYPFDVSGWKWGSAWLTTATMLERIRWQDFLFSPRGKNGAPGQLIVDQMVANNATKSAKDCVDTILEVFDIALPPEKEAVLVKTIDGLGGPTKAFANNNAAYASMRRVCKVLFSSPEAQLC